MKVSVVPEVCLIVGRVVWSDLLKAACCAGEASTGPRPR